MDETFDKEFKLIITCDQIRERVDELAKQIKRDYASGAPVCLLCVLKGGVLFFSDLAKSLYGMQITLAFMSASSYGDGTTPMGGVKIEYCSQPAFVGQHIIIVDDILDTGNTVHALTESLKAKGAASVKTAVLLDKRANRVCDIAADYVGFTLSSDKFIVGYGLDIAQKFRNLSGLYEKI